MRSTMVHGVNWSAITLNLTGMKVLKSILGITQLALCVIVLLFPVVAVLLVCNGCELTLPFILTGGGACLLHIALCVAYDRFFR